MPLPSTHASLLSLLTAILEPLPLPLMLQTSSGAVAGQNSAWRNQIGQTLGTPVEFEGFDAAPTPERAQSTAGAVSEDLLAREVPGGLEGSACELRVMTTLGALPLPLPFLETPSDLDDPWQDKTGVDIGGEMEGNADRATNMPNNICICSQPGGQERVWELVRRSLHIDAPNPSDPPLDLWIVMALDRTEPQQLTRELAVKTADLEQLKRFKDEFLACISHEMKTPLTALLGLSTLLKDQMLGPLNERQVRYARLIHHSGRHLMMIVNDILDVSRLEAGQVDLKLEAVAIEPACWQAYEQARQWQILNTEGTTATPPLQPRFELTIQPEVKTLIADSLRLRQMLTNLLSNALKFTEQGEMGLTVEVWDRWLAFTVWDTGVGIEARRQPFLFQTFQSLEPTTARRVEGTGLGLVLTQQLAKLHGGDVTFTSVEGVGSQFTLLLPLVPPQALGTPLGMTCPVLPPGKPLLLLVEGDAERLNGWLPLLDSLDCRVAIARTGSESLEKIRRLQPAAVLMNTSLPSLSGWDVLTLIKSSPETRPIPMLMVGNASEALQAMGARADGFLTLPLQISALYQQLLPLLYPNTATTEPTVFTVLHLRVGSFFVAISTENSTDTAPPTLAEVLQSYPCRLLEVDDLDQADLLARVWHPDLVLLEGDLPDPLSFLQQFGRYPVLRSLPLVTLTPENTQAANQIKGLNVYPCLAPLTPVEDSATSDASPLLQVMQVALGLR